MVPRHVEDRLEHMAEDVFGRPEGLGGPWLPFRPPFVEGREQHLRIVAQGLVIADLLIENN